MNMKDVMLLAWAGPIKMFRICCALTSLKAFNKKTERVKDTWCVHGCGIPHINHLAHIQYITRFNGGIVPYGKLCPCERRSAREKSKRTIETNTQLSETRTGNSARRQPSREITIRCYPSIIKSARKTTINAPRATVVHRTLSSDLTFPWQKLMDGPGVQFMA